MRNAFGGLLAILAVSCSTEHTDAGRLFVQAADVHDLAEQTDCTCFWPEYGYASYSACVYDNSAGLTTAQEACIVQAARPFGRFAGLLACRLTVEGARYDCYLDHDDTCDGGAFNACDSAYDAAYPCLAAEPCNGLSGADEASCDLERAQLFAAVGDCLD